MTGAVSFGLAVAARLRTQGHGVLVVLSRVAGVCAPGVLRYVFAILRVGPGFVWRRLDR